MYFVSRETKFYITYQQVLNNLWKTFCIIVPCETLDILTMFNTFIFQQIVNTLWKNKIDYVSYETQFYISFQQFVRKLWKTFAH